MSGTKKIVMMKSIAKQRTIFYQSGFIFSVEVKKTQLKITQAKKKKHERKDCGEWVSTHPRPGIQREVIRSLSLSVMLLSVW